MGLGMWAGLASALSRLSVMVFLANSVAWDREEKFIDLYVLLNSPDEPDG